MNTSELRRAFLDYFNSHGHTIVPSSSLVPEGDNTLLFANAGMNQFKQVFLGEEQRPYNRATSCQRCVRAGGKHNDLENVGFTARHHTFFEMLGNFSFGDYFKKDAIKFAWDFVTKVLKLPPERLWVSYYKDDMETRDIWVNDIKIDPNRISACDEDNFWAMGDTGPCGPCTEIFYDHGAEIPGGPPGSPDADGDRYIEIWNIVFMQYNRDTSGNLTPLPKPSVDTGMGLERVAAVMQGVHNNYEIDLFKNIIEKTAKLYNIKDLHNKSLRVIADHLRACAFLVADGVIPSNENRGYVLRRIMRRAIRHGHKLGINTIFFHTLVPFLVQEMGEPFPELIREQKNIEQVFMQEEQQFAKTVDAGLKILEQTMRDLQGSVIPGNVVFMLYDTYGFPVDLTADVAREHGLTLDLAGFDAAMAEQKARGRNASKFDMQTAAFLPKTTTDFTGYENTQNNAKVVEIFKDGASVSALQPNETGYVILDKTPFYAESGGQVGDIGSLSGNGIEFVVIDTVKIAQANVHCGENLGKTLHIGDTVTATVEANRRNKIKANHSATHLLHAALRKILGGHVAQKGSVVDDQRLRFDFTHKQPLTNEEIFAVENLVNQKIQENSHAEIKVMSTKDAMATGAMALFGEKYGDKVRVLTMGKDFSVELCGGTHTEHTGDIGFFKIISESGIAAGIRRIEAITGMTAVAWVQAQEKFMHQISDILKTTPAELEMRLQQLNTKLKTLEKQNSKLQADLASGAGRSLLQDARVIKGVKVIAAQLPAGDAKALRDAVDRYKQQIGSGVVVLATTEDNKISMVAGVTKDYTNKVNAGELINSVALQVGGKGGGRADMAQAGGDQPEHLSEALDSVYTWIENKL